MSLGLMTVQSQETEKNFSSNPFFSKYNTQYDVPPFNLIKTEHFKPAILEGMKKNKQEIAAIVNQRSVPTFENTIVALNNSGEILTKVATVFYNLNSSNTNPEIQKIASEMAPLMSEHSDDINLNDKLFQKVKAVYNSKAKLKLTPEQATLLDKTYKSFVRSGANLSAADKEKLRNVNSKLSVLTLDFGQNLLAENNNYELVISNKSDLAGLPNEIIEAAAITAKEKGKDGKWIFTLSNSSVMPFLQYSANRALRKEIWTAYVNRGNNKNKFNNNDIAIQIVNFRTEKAKLLGFKNYAEYALEETMAKTPEKVNEFLASLWAPALKKASKEEAEIQDMMTKEGITGKVEPYDWRYYSEKIRKAKFDLDEQELKPYFSLENVQAGVFMVTEKLYGLKFKPLNNVPTYHEEATVWEVLEANGTPVGVLYMDFHPRSSKSGGAWMTSFKEQSTKIGKRDLPVISIVCNFTKPTESAPALLTFDEVTTYFHEFGHALHGLLSNVTYISLAGTSVSRDFVELPSQVMENWAADPEVLKMYAKHYKTGAVIPDALINKLENAGTFGQGFETVEYLASSLLDMDFHTVKTPIKETAIQFEEKSMAKHGLISSIVPRHRANYFSHIFAGGYAAGYYSYIWSGVLDTDVFEQFKSTSLFNPEKSKSFRKNVLEKGGTEDPMELFKRFKGSEPSTKPLLKKRGLE
jgi:peptidyl-dipeptidase Dcp